MRVRVFLNESDGHWFGYRPGHDLVEAIAYDDDAEYYGRRDVEVCERAFRLFNVDLDELRNGELSLARRYRQARNRSLSVGDVLCIEDGSHARWWACAMVGWGRIVAPPPERIGGRDGAAEGSAGLGGGSGLLA